MAYQVIEVNCPEDLRDVLIAELAEIGFDSFLEGDQGFEASLEDNSISEEVIQETLSFFTEGGNVSYKLRSEEKQNWNELWESNYPMVEINDRCLIRAPFHQPEKPYEYELIITPKMSFGTGHHATTSLMVNSLMKLDCKGKTVLDAGCGTGILAIMAMKLGASQADGCDIEEWAVENSIENAEVNGVAFNVKLGVTEEFFRENNYHIILANINKNVLLEEIPLYARLLLNGGSLLLSGFYEKDVDDLVKHAEGFGLHSKGFDVKDQWATITLEKS